MGRQEYGTHEWTQRLCSSCDFRLEGLIKKMRRYRCNNNKQRWTDGAVGEALASLYINVELAQKKKESWLGFKGGGRRGREVEPGAVIGGTWRVAVTERAVVD
jgi:hypothetical protein